MSTGPGGIYCGDVVGRRGENGVYCSNAYSLQCIKEDHSTVARAAEGLMWRDRGGVVAGGGEGTVHKRQF